MKKLVRYLMMTVMAICFAVPCFSSAEAATVALLPLVNNVEGGDELANQVYYKQTIAVVNSKPGFVVVENDALNAAVEAANISGAVPDEAALAEIAKKGNVDIVFAVQLDTLAKKPLMRTGERYVKLNMAGKAVAYNRLTGVYYSHNLKGDKEIDEALTSRWDWTHEEFGRAVRVELERALRAK